MSNQAPAEKTILNPTYWGSLCALFVGLAFAFVDAIKFGANKYVHAEVDSSIALAVLIFTLLIVFFFTIRYYCAVCVNIYGTYQGSIKSWPKIPRKIAFLLLSILVLVCICSVAAVSVFGIATSYYLCIIMGVISFLLFIPSFTLKYVNSKKYGDIENTFGVVDLGLIGISYWAYRSIGSGTNEDTVIGLAVITFLVGGLVIVEIYRKYWEAFSKQFRHLQSWLNS